MSRLGSKVDKEKAKVGAMIHAWVGRPLSLSPSLWISYRDKAISSTAAFSPRSLYSLSETEPTTITHQPLYIHIHMHLCIITGYTQNNIAWEEYKKNEN